MDWPRILLYPLLLEAHLTKEGERAADDTTPRNIIIIIDMPRSFLDSLVTVKLRPTVQRKKGL
jgi:hypothetical protein